MRESYSVRLTLRRTVDSVESTCAATEAESALPGWIVTTRFRMPGFGFENWMRKRLSGNDRDSIACACWTSASCRLTRVPGMLLSVMRTSAPTSTAKIMTQTSRVTASI